MTISDFKFEAIFRINSRDGYFYEVRPDPHGLGMIDFHYYEKTEDTKPAHTISMQREVAVMVIDAIEKMLKVKP